MSAVLPLLFFHNGYCKEHGSVLSFPNMAGVKSVVLLGSKSVYVAAVKSLVLS